MLPIGPVPEAQDELRKFITNESYEIAGEFITTVYKNTDILKVNSNLIKK